MTPLGERWAIPAAINNSLGRGRARRVKLFWRWLLDELLKAGYRYVVDADLAGYFDTIPHRRLLEQVRKKVSDGRVA